ncbi:MAG: DUF2782 domain-containing protein [Rhodocyclaceae bacterium]|nr:DUF2782 domain-containing protein [Rhodocyclaceae bacterium]MBX3670413.1 DUF2782 domain-containing protein [Rhodocyclaceae bacterium]
MAHSFKAVLAVALCLAAHTAMAQFKGQPSDLEPVPAPPDAPADYQPPEPAGAGTEPEVTIRQRGREKVEEYRMHGRLYMMKVTPAHGVPYVLVDEDGSGNMIRRDGIDSGLRVPMWTLRRF